MVVVVFNPENVYEQFVSKSIWAEIHRAWVGHVEEYIHDPCCQEGRPPDSDHHPDLVLCHIMGKTIDINQPHVWGNSCHSLYCHSTSYNELLFCLSALTLN